jgi:predicted nuclease of predicted toxin-antitoxin system
VYAFAWRKHRFILTHDSDFLDNRRFPFHRNPGVVILPGAQGDTKPLEQELARVLTTLDRYRDAYRGFKISITDDAVWTISSFDVQRGAHIRRRLRFDSRGEVWEWSVGK